MLKNIIKAVTVIGFVSLSATAMAQDAASEMGAGGTVSDRSLCGDNGECRRALTQCESDLKASQAGATAAIDATRECRQRLLPVVPKRTTPPAPPACSGTAAMLKGSACECHKVVDGKATDEIDPELVPVHRAGANVIVCVSGPEALLMARELKRRLETDIVPKVPGWDATHDAVNILLTQINVPNADPAVIAARFNELWTWYQDESKRQKRIDEFLDNPDGLPSLIAMRNTYCPAVPGKANATWEERCRYGIDSFRDTKVEFRAGARGGFISTPGGGMGSMLVGNAELEFRVNDKASVVVGGYFGGINNRDTGGMFLYGGEIGPRFHLTDDRKLTLDILAYGQGRTSVHGGGYHGMATGFVGKDAGIRPRLGYCVSEGFCISGDLSVGYGTQNYWSAPYVMDKATGPVFMGGLGIHGHVNLF